MKKVVIFGEYLSYGTVMYLHITSNTVGGIKNIDIDIIYVMNMIHELAYLNAFQ